MQARKELELLKDSEYTLVFYEAPHRMAKTLNLMLDIFGVEYDIINLSIEDKELFNKWNEYKAAKDFVKADEIRNELMKRNLLQY